MEPLNRFDVVYQLAQRFSVCTEGSVVGMFPVYDLCTVWDVRDTALTLHGVEIEC